jgi:3-phosphoshikimate 1-carboxyvinyltransferase
MMGALGRERAELAAHLARQPGRSRHRPGLQPHPRRRHDAGRDGAVCRRHDDLAQYRQLARQGNRPHQRDGLRTAKARRLVEEGADSSSVTPRPSSGPRIHTYDDHRVAMCFSLAAFNGLNPAPACRCASSTPNASPRPSRTTSRALFSVAEADASAFPSSASTARAPPARAPWPTEVAHRLGYHYLDSGALYRAERPGRCAGRRVAGRRHGVAAWRAPCRCTSRATACSWGPGRQSDAIRDRTVGMAASRVSALIRRCAPPCWSCSTLSRSCPGLVADGRDMGTVMFPRGAAEVFLTASAARAERRHKQLISKGNSATIAEIQQDLEARDARDSSRKAAPLKPADDARLLDNSYLSIEKSVDQVIDWWQGTRPF